MFRFIEEDFIKIWGIFRILQYLDFSKILGIFLDDCFLDVISLGFFGCFTFCICKIWMLQFFGLY